MLILFTNQQGAASQQTGMFSAVVWTSDLMHMRPVSSLPKSIWLMSLWDKTLAASYINDA